jgi:hypothetical protein
LLIAVDNDNTCRALQDEVVPFAATSMSPMELKAVLRRERTFKDRDEYAAPSKGK